MIASHGGRRLQIDAVAISWQPRQILLGECKWGEEPVSRSVVREPIGTKAPLVLQELPQGGQGWGVAYALLARAGLTEPAAQELAAYGGSWWMCTGSCAPGPRGGVRRGA